ncbi:DUF4160 domain-containing protein [Brachyspira hyodysenteriae]|uniref:DUF4160 domain-containing protein n=1 Tax=Brachyspira hyodysenteriae TaxID=159 RepID=UPI0022CD97D8|nr:DUF4160 domain-containing protein [Brachyspira hyodysenteriae]MCZ9851220.1 DUF4160 domain-containing protein [Brachyspira hyodysenteriae]MCZ9860054.1 DUF4160 domain-containing protein [Brachyspira hyodysenteriae]MCZ9870556.1 DUF4160 domain-containing protein [Brachyspira hyodysenteriae]MCZ9876933.1 DUF4160 domain-containing protein [Brachyspira hyodysenteriae]MCZ9878714.1 DUF4160 domain-containing protein [Brachyspira hyodysenteriae]
MPVISRFYGIIIKMYFQQKEHNPPHFHAIYGEYVGVIDINKLKMIEGDLPNKACSLVLEWAKNNQDELLNMWNTQNFKQLEPLE